MVKKTAVKALAARGMPKEHPEFRELFGRITHGVGFALVCPIALLETSSDLFHRDERSTL